MFGCPSFCSHNFQFRYDIFYFGWVFRIVVLKKLFKNALILLIENDRIYLSLLS
nr:MAG TPA: hypothetical protein [Caudoviricetes sp.]DAZ16383.1 MAG TPA: hypothetical protein [Caudoviricetes sp.]